jgi:hypothetical protein
MRTVLLFLFLLLSAAPTLAVPLGNVYSGVVLENGTPLSNAVLSVSVEGEMLPYTVISDAQGFYRNLQVTGNIGDAVEVYVNGVKVVDTVIIADPLDSSNPLVREHLDLILGSSLNAVIHLRYTKNNAGSPVHFNGSASTGNITGYNWSFGDGETASGAVLYHIYAVHNYTGYNVSLQVEDNGLRDTAFVIVPVWHAGDANGDGRVNIIDAATVGLHWNSEYDTPDYDDGADLNNDDVVNIIDAAIVGLNWGISV